MSSRTMQAMDNITESFDRWVFVVRLLIGILVVEFFVGGRAEALLVLVREGSFVLGRVVAVGGW